MRTLRALIAVGLLAGFYLLVVAVVAAFGGAGIWVIVWHPSALGAKLILVCALVVFAIGRAFWVVLRAGSESDTDESTLPLPEGEHPELWREVRELAAAVRTRAPDEIRLCTEVNAGVTEKARLLGLRSGPRTMYIGAPLLVGLDADQLRSVLAHELGHYSGAHTRLGALIYRGAEQIELVIAHLEGHAVVRTVFQGYRALYMATSAAVRRQQEIEADMASATLVGPAVAASALRELAVIDAAWGHYIRNYLGPAFEAGVRPDETFEGLRRLITDPGRAESLARIRSADQDGERSAFDSHPPVSRRVAALAQYPEISRVRDARPASELLSQPGATFRTLVERAFVSEIVALPTLSWQAIAPYAGQELVRSGAAALQSGADALLEAPATLADVLRLYETEVLGRLGEVVVHASGGVMDRTREVAVSALAAYVAALAVNAGTARWELSWSEPVHLVGQDGEPADVTTAARALLEPAGDMAGVRDIVTRLGLVATARYVEDGRAAALDGRAGEGAVASAGGQAGAPAVA